jgi:peptidoglycan/xylan/chitin deacetylase (PgdA/CDA1 family)
MAARLAAFCVVLVLAGSADATTRGIEVERLPTRAKVVALTFDGGGDTANGTTTIVKVLRRRRVPATFFLAGRWIRLHPRLARTIGRHFRVGNHTFDHAQQTGLTDAEIRRDVRQGAWWVHAGTGQDPRPLFRFPYGARDARTIAVVNALGYTSVRWSLDTWGWMGRSGGQSVGSVVRRVAEHLQSGTVVLMHVGVAHDGSLLDAEALPRVILLVRARGYRFVGLDRYVTAPR